jgi:soluble lytic murein transglycosylase-like protein
MSEVGRGVYLANLEKARKALLDRAGTQYKTESAQEQLEDAKEGLMRPRARPEVEVDGPSEGLGLGLMRAMSDSKKAQEPTVSGQAPDKSIRPQPRYATEFQGEYEAQGDLKNDPSFLSAIEGLAEKRGISTSELYKVIQGESGFNPRAQNKSGAAGLFQFMPDTAKELGVNSSDILSMSPKEQVELYDKYLERWNYNSSNRLGIMQAAPAFASRKPDAVIYSKGSAAWKQNPGWRELNDGPITVRSINSYYARQK